MDSAPARAKPQPFRPRRPNGTTLRLAEAIPTASIHGNPCSVADQLPHLAQLDPELHADILAWFERPAGVNDAQIHNVLQARGLRVSRDTIGKHRRHDCRCYR